MSPWLIESMLKWGVFYFLYTLGKLAKRGGGWLPSGAIEGCYPPGMLELSEILILVKKPSPKRRLSVNNLSWKKKKIQKENQESECLTVPRLSALASWLVYVWRIRVTGSPTYATRSVTLILTVSIGWQETFTEMDSQIFISAIKQPVAARPKGFSDFFERHGVFHEEFIRRMHASRCFRGVSLFYIIKKVC